MTTSELDQRLRAFLTDRDQDPVVDPLRVRGASLEAQLTAAEARHTAAMQAESAAHLAAETALANGTKVDTASLARTRAAVADTEQTARLLGGALKQCRLDVSAAVHARAARDQAALTPLFAEAIAAYYDRALALLDAQQLLEHAHDVATRTLPGVDSALQQGFVAGGFTREGLAAWRQRAEAFGFFASNAEKVA